MHIEPGVVDGTKMVLSYATAITSVGIASKMAITNVKENGFISMLGKVVMTTFLVLVFFQVFPHHPIGISEVHLILGSTLFLLFGADPAAFGLCLGLLTQGLIFAPIDLPMYGVNVTTLLMPLFAMSYLSKKIIPPNIAYKDIRYKDALKLSLTYQGGIVSWVAFWAFYGQGFGAENLASVVSFGSAYMSVVILEPFVDLGVLALVKMASSLETSSFVEKRLFNSVANA